MARLKGTTLVETLVGFTLIVLVVGILWGVFQFIHRHDAHQKHQALETLRYYHAQTNDFQTLKPLDTLNWHIEPVIIRESSNVLKVTYKVYRGSKEPWFHYGFIELNDED
jgi:hypothetical protein